MMNIKRLASVMIFIGYALTAAFAQEKAPLAKPEQQNKIKTIFSYKNELGLTDKQVADLVTILTDFQKYLTEQGKAMRELRAKLNDLIKQKSELKSIREVLERIAGIQADTSYIDVETSRKVEGALTPSQLKKWNSIQEAAVKQEMQARQLQMQGATKSKK
jgi:Spy/CpxP family protein refolding chaperone